MRSNEIRQIGDRLRQAGLETISTGDLMTVLRRATNTMGTEELKKYMAILKDDGYIRFTPHGYWDIVPEIKKERKEISPPPIETVDELDKKIDEVKTAKIINPMEEHNKLVIERDERKYRQQLQLLIKQLEQETKKAKAEAMHKGGIFVIWIDLYEYHVVCETCYNESGIKYNRTGNASLSDILARKPKVCEYCGAKLEEYNDLPEE